MTRSPKTSPSAQAPGPPRTGFIGTVVGVLSSAIALAHACPASAAPDRDGWSVMEYEQCNGGCEDWSLQTCGESEHADRCPVAQLATGYALFSDTVSKVDGTLMRLQGSLDNGAAWVLMVDLPGPVRRGNRYLFDTEQSTKWLYYEIFDGNIIFDANRVVGEIFVDDSGPGAWVFTVDLCLHDYGADQQAGAVDATSRRLTCGAAGVWATQGVVSGGRVPTWSGGSSGGGTTEGGGGFLDFVLQVVTLGGDNPYDEFAEDESGCRRSDTTGGCGADTSDNSDDTASGGCSDPDGTYNNEGDSGCSGDSDDDDSSDSDSDSEGCSSDDDEEAQAKHRRRSPGAAGRLTLLGLACAAIWGLRRRPDTR